MENSKKYSDVRQERLHMFNSDAANADVTEGRIFRVERVSFISSNDEGEGLMKDAGAFNTPAYLRPIDAQINEPEHQQSPGMLGAPPQSIIEGIPVVDENSINWRALYSEAKTYELEKFEKNIMLIFNHFNVPGYEHRHGTEKDVDALKKTFEPLGFECTEYPDFNESEIFDKLEMELETQNLTNIGCVAVCILTHGENNGMLWAKDRTYSEVKVLNYFKADRNPTLLTKPKLLIIQACRGPKSTVAAEVFQTQSTIRKDHKEPQHYHLPIEADILVFHGSVMNTPALRCQEKGSWLIQALCENVRNLAANEDLESILLQVKKTIAVSKSYNETNEEGVTELLTQMPVITSTLLRKLYFHRSDFEVKDASGPITYQPPKPDDVFSSGNTSKSRACTCMCRCVTRHFAYVRDLVRRYESNFDDPTVKSILKLADKFTEETDIEFVANVRNLLCAQLKKLDVSESDLFYLDYE